MIETANTFSRSSSDTSKRARRQRAISSVSGSSSTTGCDIPRTPVNAHDKDVSRVYSKGTSPPNFEKPPLGFHPHHFEEAFTSSITCTEEQVPGWIYETVSSLDRSHPVHSIVHLPPNLSSFQASTFDQGHSHHVPVNANPAAKEEEIFAFRPPTTRSFPQSQPLSTNSYVQETNHHIPSISPRPLLTDQPTVSANHIQELLDTASALQEVPFATPGPLTANPSSSQIPPSSFLKTSYTIPTAIISLEDEQAHLAVGLLDLPTYISDAANNIRIQPQNIAQTASLPSVYDLQHSIINQKSDPDYSFSYALRSPSVPRILAPSSQGQPIIDALPASPDAKSLDTYQQNSDRQAKNNDSPTSIIPTTPPLVSRQPRAAEFKIYFDDPIEDPSDPSSDPLEEPDYKFDLDYEHLDFRWCRFEPSGLPDDSLVMKNEQNFWVKQNVHPKDRMYNATLSTLPCTPVRRNEASMPKEPPFQQADPSTFDISSDADQPRSSDESWSLLSRVRKATNNGQRPVDTRTGTQQSKTLPVVAVSPQSKPKAFASAPGIYVSPLRDNTDAEDDLEVSETAPGPHATLLLKHKRSCTPERPTHRVRESSFLSNCD